MYFLAAFLSLALCGLGIANAEDTAAWPSAGCAAKPTYPPYPVDIPLEMTVKVPDQNLYNQYRDYIVYFPPGYTGTEPLPVVFYFPSFYITSDSAFIMNKLYWLSGQEGGNFIIVIPNGMNDCGQLQCQPGGLQTVGWNTYGTGINSIGPMGPTCMQYEPNKVGDTVDASSCRAQSPTNNCSQNPCVSASCSNDTLFFETVLAEVQAMHCVDERRQYVTGMSVGAMLALEIAAGAVPAAAGALYGYWKPPVAPIPFMDIHGLYDDTIPANITNSHRYDINGNSGAPDVNGCTMANAEGWNSTKGSWIPWETTIDGEAGWQCGLAFGTCPPEHPLVRCTWNGMHELPLVGKRANYSHQHIPPNNLTHPQKVHAFARVAWEFLKPLYKPGSRPSPVGGGAVPAPVITVGLDPEPEPESAVLQSVDL
eukprot:gene7905-6902_t